jgi:hypothetical protein
VREEEEERGVAEWAETKPEWKRKYSRDKLEYETNITN